MDNSPSLSEATNWQYYVEFLPFPEDPLTRLIVTRTVRDKPTTSLNLEEFR